jgi:hypothetical protein
LLFVAGQETPAEELSTIDLSAIAETPVVAKTRGRPKRNVRAKPVLVHQEEVEDDQDEIAKEEFVEEVEIGGKFKE